MSVNAPATVAPRPRHAQTHTPARGSTAALIVYRLAALFTFLAVAMGAVVSATGSGAACPTWPGCRPGEIAPQWALSPVVEFAHRVAAISAGPLVLAAAVLAWRLTTRYRWVRVLPWVALAGAIAAGAFGRLVVLSSLPTWLGAVDLCCALTAMTVMAVGAVLAARPAATAGHPAAASANPAAPSANPAATTANPAAPSANPASPVASGPRPSLTARTAAAAVVVLIAMHVTGILTAGPGSYTRTVGWPFWHLIASDLHPWLQVVRLCLAGIAAVLVAVTAVSAARDARLRRWGLAAGALFAAEMVLGLVIRVDGLHNGIAATYAVLAAGLLWCLGLMAAVALATEPAVDGAIPAQKVPAAEELARPTHH